MSVKRPGSALSSGAEPLEPLNSKELQKTVKAGEFASQLEALESAAGAGGSDGTDGVESKTMQGLRQIAANSDLSTQERTEAAVRESARFMVKTRIKEQFQENEKITGMIEELSEFVAGDPFLGKKLERILQRLKEQ
jgi:hypothetical protein